MTKESGRRRDAHKKLAELLESTTAKLQNGTTVPINLDSEHAEHAEELQRLVPLLQLLQQLGTDRSSDASVVDDSAGVVLDDYRIIREIGRGGMGIVYEAQQISAGRRVALKVFPFTLFIKAKQLRRFHNEARAAASLDHPHIVPVYSAGSVGRIHYYTMQLIEGRSLEELIALCQQRTVGRHLARVPADVGATEAGSVSSYQIIGDADTTQHCRQVAQLGIQVADALQHAHLLGVDHRDIKPSNLLVTAEGHVSVTDFGLAHIAGEPSLTRTGDLLGTLRYMPPEQVLTNTLTVDHRADVYSLGVTLYEMLTLQAAFPAHQRGKLLQQLTDQTPRPPRKFNRLIPRNLETIVLKAMADRPADRYQAAGDLAADLRRFLEQRPIVGRRPSLLHRAAKVSRRYASPVGAALVVFAMLILSLTAAAIVAPRPLAVAPTAKSSDRHGTDTTQPPLASPDLPGADSDFRTAMSAVDHMLRTADQDLVGVAATDHIWRALLEDALKDYKEYTREKPADAAVSQQLAMAFGRMGAIQHRLGRYRESTDDYQHAEQLLQQLVRSQPQNPRIRTELSAVLNQLAHVQLETSDHSDKAEEMVCQRISLLQGLAVEVGDEPQYGCELASAFSDHGYVLAEMGRSVEAEQQYQRSLDLWENCVRTPATATRIDTGLANARHQYGELLVSTLRLAEAKPHLELAQQLWRRLANNDTPQWRYELAHAQQDLALLLCKMGDRLPAERYLRDAISICEQLTEDYPETVDYSHRRAVCQYDLYRLLLAQDRRDEARASLQQSSLSLEAIADDTAGAVKYVAPLARNVYITGLRAYFGEDKTAAEEHFRRVAQLLEAGLDQYPDAIDLGSQLAWFLATCPDAQFQNADRAVVLASRSVEHEPEDARHWLVLGAARYRAGEWAASRAALEKVGQLRNGGDHFNWLLLALVHAQMGQSREASDWYRRASDWGKLHTCDSERIASLQFEAAQIVGVIVPTVVQ